MVFAPQGHLRVTLMRCGARSTAPAGRNLRTCTAQMEVQVQ
ncbi:hypothetical protein PENNAL_c0512G01733, partial [Penicillium nalgiovense]